MWKLNDKEKAYFNESISNIDSHYTNWSISSSCKIDIDIEKNYDFFKGFKIFFKLV